MIRGYDSGVKLREDIIVKVKYLRDEIATLQNFMDKLKEEAAVTEESIQRLKRELDITN